MHVRSSSLPFVFAAGLSAAACGESAPTRPSISFAAPTAASPAGASYNFSEQPIVLRIANAVRTGSAAVTYGIEVSTSAAFSTLTFEAADVAEGNGVTTIQLPMLAGGTTYYWRTRAIVDGIDGAPSAASTFFVRPAITLQTPTVVSPTDGSPVFFVRPTFTVENVARSGQPGPLTYEFQVSESAAFGSLAASGAVAEQASRTAWTPGVDLPVGTLYWRARAVDYANDVPGPFTAPHAFERRGFGASGDQLDLLTATIVLGPSNIGTWPVTSTVTSTVARPGQICIEHTSLNSWPGTAFFDDPGTLTQGNQWMFAFINGQWYGGGGRWSRPGQACKATNADDGFSGTFYMEGTEPLRSYVPRQGDLIGLMFTTPARFYPSMRTIDQRTNVVVVPWGG